MKGEFPTYVTIETIFSEQLMGLVFHRKQAGHTLWLLKVQVRGK